MDNFPINNYMALLAAHDVSVAYVDIHDVLCGNGSCSPYVNGVPVYFNPTHLSAAGSYLIGQSVLGTPLHDSWLAAFSGVVPRSRAMLAGGYQPSFPYKIRSQRHVPAGKGRSQHVVIAEYLRIDGRAVASHVTADLTSRGFAVQGPRQNETSTRYVARRGPETLTIDIHAKPVVPLINASARGIVSFAWKDSSTR